MSSVVQVCPSVLALLRSSVSAVSDTSAQTEPSYGLLLAHLVNEDDSDVDAIRVMGIVRSDSISQDELQACLPHGVFQVGYFFHCPNSSTSDSSILNLLQGVSSASSLPASAILVMLVSDDKSAPKLFRVVQEAQQVTPLAFSKAKTEGFSDVSIFRLAFQFLLSGSHRSLQNDFETIRHELSDTRASFFVHGVDQLIPDLQKFCSSEDKNSDRCSELASTLLLHASSIDQVSANECDAKENTPSGASKIVRSAKVAKSKLQRKSKKTQVATAVIKKEALEDVVQYVSWMRKQSPLHVAPTLSVDLSDSSISVDFSVDVMCWAPPSWPLAHVLTALQQHALRQLSHVQRAFFTRVQNEASSSSPRFYTARVYQFSPPQLAHPISHCYVCEPSLHDEEEDGTKAQRQAIHSAFFLPLDRPLIRTSNAVSLSASIWNRRVVTSVAPESSKKLRNVHLYAKPSGLVGSTQYLVDGEYVYHHYMQDKFNDKGWGCAYRTLQSICSWLQVQRYSNRSPPSHREVQEALVELKDKPASFVGSSQWIGAIELGLVLKHIYGIIAKTMFVPSGAEIPNHARSLALHFQTQGTPVMIGGGELAYGLLGVDYNELTGDVKFLILDPHYTGAEDIETIIKGGWCAWKTADLFIKHCFYNFCLPQRPKVL